MRMGISSQPSRRPSPRPEVRDPARTSPDLPSLRPQPLPVLPQPAKRRQRAALDGQDPSEHDEIAGRGGDQGLPRLCPGLVVDPQQKPILDGVHVRQRAHLSAPLWQIAPPVVGDRRWHVEAPPAQVAQPPGEIGVLAVEEEVGIKVAGRDPGALERGAAIEPRGPRSAADILLHRVSPGGRLAGSAVEVPPRRGEVDARRIQAVGRRQIESFGTHDAAGRGADVSRIGRIETLGEDRREARLEPAIGIQCQHVPPGGRIDPRVHRGGESDVYGQREQPHGRSELPRHLARSVGRGVVDQERLAGDALLRDGRAERGRQIRGVVLGDDDDGNLRSHEGRARARRR